MKRTFKTFSSLLLVFVMLMGLLSTTSFAADTTVTYTGVKTGFSLGTGSEYTDTDLFHNFKGVMPGDQLTQTIRVKNEARDCDYIKLYIRAEAHDEQNNPLSQTVSAYGETVATMEEFLSKLHMKVYHESKLIYEASPDELDGLTENVYLGTFRSGQSSTLAVELNVPLDLENRYANRVGEVDWIFTAEAFNTPSGPSTSKTTLTVHKVWNDGDAADRPQSVAVTLLRNGQAYEKAVLDASNQWTHTWGKLDKRYQWSVTEEVPEGYTATYSVSGATTVITNTKEIKPVEPDVPDVPVDPGVPDIPDVPDTPDIPDVPDSPDIPDVPAEPKSLTVHKVWSGDESARKNRPETIGITLYNGRNPVETVLLGEHNGWTYSWNTLDGAGVWSAMEDNIPRGYVPSYHADGTAVTITNTATLIQTGQINWPIPVLGTMGLVLIGLGMYTMLGKKKPHEEE